MNSLIISDKEKYGEDSPNVSCPGGPGENTKPEERKSAPTVELTGPQVVAFGLDGATNLEQVGCAKIYFKVKAVRAGEIYGDSVTTKKSPTKITIQVTDVEVLENEEAPAEDVGESDASETPAEDAAEGEGEVESPEGKTSTSADPEESLKTKAKKKQAAVMGHTMEKVSPKDAELP